MSELLGRAREQRASLRAAMGAVESALAAPTPSRERQWRQELGTRLSELNEALEWHISSTEGDDGLLAEIVSSAPRLAHRVDRARADHEHLRSLLRAATDAVEADEGVASLRDQVVELLAALVRHRQLGSDLVYEAYNVDIEAAD
jgi:hypothetical protein